MNPLTPTPHTVHRTPSTGEVAARHARSFAKHRTVLALEHARALKAGRGERTGSEPDVETRPLAIYDQLIA